MRATLTALCLSLAAPVAAGEFTLTPPLACDLGEDCHIQQYVDADPGPEAPDYRCGTLSYEAHKGTDFALRDLSAMAVGVPVLAAAPGVVTALRDGMEDGVFARGDTAAVADRECGNGMVISHGDGWETQYCHLRRGSVQVTKGQRVARGAVLGAVGMSGKSQFPHVHLSVRQDGKVVDPFAPKAAHCGATVGPDLWQDTPVYEPGGLIAAGFSGGMPSYDAVKAGRAAVDGLSPDAPALVLYGYAFGGQTGDVIELAIDGPDGRIIAHDIQLEKNQAQLFRAVGKRQPQGGWPAGSYTGTVRMLRDGEVIDREEVKITIN
ncbi:MAG: M23 family metallopeptidase [Pseudodonghicola sp.]|nr:M23 family metallopeptidase [Pseudodonghicola sp.]